LGGGGGGRGPKRGEMPVALKVDHDLKGGEHPKRVVEGGGSRRKDGKGPLKKGGRRHHPKRTDRGYEGLCMRRGERDIWTSKRPWVGGDTLKDDTETRGRYKRRGVQIKQAVLLEGGPRKEYIGQAYFKCLGEGHY